MHVSMREQYSIPTECIINVILCTYIDSRVNVFLNKLEHYNMDMV